MALILVLSTSDTCKNLPQRSYPESGPFRVPGRSLSWVGIGPRLNCQGEQPITRLKVLPNALSDS